MLYVKNTSFLQYLRKYIYYVSLLKKKKKNAFNVTQINYETNEKSVFIKYCL